MPIRSLRAQLALWHAGLLAATLLALAAFTYLVLRGVLHSRADAALARYAETVAARIAVELYRRSPNAPAGQTTSGELPRVLDRDAQSLGRYVQIVSRDGVVKQSSDALRSFSLPRSSQALLRGLQGQVTFETIGDLGEYPLRVVTTPVQMGEEVPYLVQAAASLEGVEAALQRAAIILLVLTPAVFVASLVGGSSLVGRALRPVDELTRAAMEVEHRRLHTRVTPPRPDDEIGRLAGAFNEMLSRLDQSFHQIQQFSADASHELKTPLTTIRGEAEVALMGELQPEEYRRALRSIVEEVERMSAVVENLLTLARADADRLPIRRAPLALHEIVMSVFETQSAAARRKGVSLDLEEVDEVNLFGDAFWLQQAVENLVTNAIKYTPEGGEVRLSLTHEDEPAESIARARFSVRDTGIGIPAEHLPHVFDRFYRVDADRARGSGGAGLGLAITQRIIEAHGGALAAESEVGRGSTFTVCLPIEA